MKKRIVSLLMAVALIFGMIAIPGIIPDAAAAASVGTLTVDLSKDAINPNVENGEILHGTAGFLYGISNEDVPTTNTLVPLKPKILVTKGAVGTEHPYGDSLDVAKTFLESGGWQIQMYVSNYYGVFGVTATPQEFAQVLKDYICPAVVAWKKAWKEEHGTPDKPKDNIGASIDIDEAIVYVPINEGTPAKLDDGDYNDDFNQSWDIYWDAIKEVDPEASFVGPNSCSYGVQFNYNHWWTNKQATINKDGQEISVSDGMLDYFQHCADTNRLPDVVSWHELETEDLDGIHYHMEDFKNIWYYGVDWEKYFEITGATEIPKLPQVCINEYLDIWSSGVPGKMVNWMARLEDEGMTGTLAYYHQANNLDDLTAGANEGNAAWWVFQWYGNMAGTLQEVETDTHYSELYGLATMDEEKDLATAIFGGYTGTIKVDLENVTSRDAFKGAKWVNVTVEEASYLGFHGAVEETPVIVKGIYPVNADGSVTVTIDNAQAPNAYKVTVQQASEESLAEAGLILTRSNGTVYEAEAATLGGGASVYSGSRSPIYYFSGDKVVAMPTNGTLTYTIDVPADGLYRLDFVYGNGQGSNRLNRFTHNPQNITQSISLDGATAENVIMENTLYEDMAGLKTRYYNLTAGTHTIVVKTVSTVDANKVCHDFLRVSYEGVYNQARPAFNTVYEAELADFNKLITISGYPSATAAKGSSISGYSGGGYVTGLTNSVTSGAGVRFTVVVEDSGLYNLSLHYQSTDSGTANIYVGNTATTLDNKVQSVSVGASSAWTDATATVYLQKGINVVDIDATADIALDYLRVRALDAQDDSTTIEAENAIPAAMTDKIEVAESTGASNGKYVVGMEGAYEDADYLEFTYDAPAAGEYEMQIFHSNNDMSDGHYQSFKIMDKYAIVEVNGESDSPDFVIVDDPNEASGTFNDVVYFVDCGDHDPSTVNTGEKLGSHNSVTDKVYGADAETGYKWGFELIDSNDVVIDAPNGPANKVVEGDKAIYTTYQYARCNEYAQVVDGLDKNQSSRYANNQDNNGINPRRITYKFEVEPKLYEVTVGMGDIWNNALNPTVTLSADGVADVSLTYQVPKYSYQVQKMQIDLTNATTNSNGMVELTVKGTSSDPTIHMNFIKIAAKNVYYFVDCGDHNPSTVNTGEKLGSHNSVTDKVYGADAETGYKWGFELIDSNDVVIDAPNGPANKVVEGDKAIYTTYQYARCNEYAQVVDGLDKNQSSRYANNQDNNGINPRRITYKFEVEPKLYEVTVGMGDIWNNALNPTVTLSADGVADVSLTYQVPKYSYQVQKMQIDLTNATTNSNGMVELTVKGTSSDPTIHMNYILIADSSDDETAGDDTGDNASAESVVRLPQGVYVDATQLPDDIYIGKLTKDYMKYIDFRNLKNETDRYFFINSFSDDTFEEKTVTLTLNAGANTIRIYNDNSWNATVGGSNSTPATDELPNYTPNFDKFVITPQALSAAVAQTAEYNVSIYASEGGTAVANVNTVAANGSYTLTITADSSKNTKVYINGENFTDKVIKTASGYSLNVENVTKDQNVNVYFTVSDETLNDLIEQAEALVEEDYTSNSWEDLVEALEEAESAESESEKTTAFNELAKALDELVNKDKSVYYFVDCGDHDPSTVTGKNDDFGWNNSVTDQVYGEDTKTGYSWGFELIAEKNEVVIDAPNGASNKVVEGDKAIYSTYQYARCNEDYQVADGLDKNESSRYAHNQKESGISPRRVTYKFELDPGEYKVTVSMGDIWSNALNPTVTLVADGVDNVAESYSIAAYGYQEKTMSINLTNAEKNSNGKVELSVKGTSTNDTIHMNYIIIRGENVVVPDPTVPATGVTLDAANATLIVDETKQLTATVLPEGATDSTVTWKSSDLTVATVDERGLVTAVSKGTATITVTTTDGGHTATCVVTVVDKTELNELIEEAEGLEENEDDYTEESWAALEKALEDAKAIYEDENASQANVDAATETLEAAIAALEEKPSEPDYPEFPDYPLPPFRPIIPVVGGAVEEPAEFPFVDVPENAWFYDEVKQAWENDLIDGVTGTLYKPEETLTVAQAIKLAAALHQMYNNGKVTLTNGAPNWYDSYVRYAVANGIIEAKYDNYNLTQMNAPISREEFVHIFHGAMNEKAYYACNHVADNAIPDVKMNDTYASEIYTFYRAGILTGSDAQGTFNPDSSIKRSEVAAILIRMYDANARQAVTLS